MSNEMGKRCKAMVGAGISDPESQSGIDFCVNCCPYKYCIIFEGQRQRASNYHGARERANLAQVLNAHGTSKDDIALILKVTIHTVHHYLRQRRQQNRYALGVEDTSESHQQPGDKNE